MRRSGRESGVLGILWDNDGVLVETEPLYFRAGAETLAGIGITLDRRQYVEISLGRGASVFELAESRGLPRDAIEALRARRDARYAELLAAGVPLRPGIDALLRELHGRVRMAIVTSSPAEHFRIIHEQTGLLDLFEFALVREEYGRSKPDPEPYREGLARLGLPADRVVAIEDTARGLASARAAGLRCLVLPNGMYARQAFDGAHAVVPTAEALRAELDLLLGRPAGGD